MANLCDEAKERYFVVNEEKYCLKEEVKRAVELYVMNIFDVKFTQLKKFDYIFSRNLFIYFDEPTKKRAASILESLLKNENSKIFFGHADLL